MTIQQMLLRPRFGIDDIYLETRLLSGEHLVNDSTSAFATFQFNGDYVQGATNSMGTTNLFKWLNSGQASNYQVRWTVLSGSVSGPTGTWEDLGGSAVTWSLSRAISGTSNAAGSVEVRNKITGNVAASATFSLSVTKGTGGVGL